MIDVQSSCCFIVSWRSFSRQLISEFAGLRGSRSHLYGKIYSTLHGVVQKERLGSSALLCRRLTLRAIKGAAASCRPCMQCNDGEDHYVNWYDHCKELEIRKSYSNDFSNNLNQTLLRKPHAQRRNSGSQSGGETNRDILIGRIYTSFSVRRGRDKIVVLKDKLCC